MIILQKKCWGIITSFEQERDDMQNIIYLHVFVHFHLYELP